MQSADKMQEEEIYALLDSAMQDERLCVSEDLIQKTLRRVKEENEAKVIPLKSRRKLRYTMVRYGCAAAAAVLVLVLGVKLWDGNGFALNMTRQESVSDGAIRKTNDKYYSSTESVADGSKHELSATADMSVLSEEPLQDSGKDRKNGAGAEESESRGGVSLRSTPVELSAALREAVSEGQIGAYATDAEYWELVQSKTDWEAELIRELGETVPVKQSPEKAGTYEYMLVCRNEAEKAIGCEEPLECIVRIETEQGTLWCLFGETVRFYMEQ